MTLQLAILALVTLAAVLACRRAMNITPTATSTTITPTATSTTTTTTTPSTISLASNISTATIIPPSPSLDPMTQNPF
ncbi:hypothetical protein LOAG_03048 [Loa loa]|nr:hypothetical protein LOAG_03048 [Loa loa]EFO25435.2 hypothetical protein LOAG_03048 [Loa loa]